MTYKYLYIVAGEKYVTMPFSITRDQGYNLNESAIYMNSLR